MQQVVARALLACLEPVSETEDYQSPQEVTPGLASPQPHPSCILREHVRERERERERESE